MQQTPPGVPPVDDVTVEQNASGQLAVKNNSIGTTQLGTSQLRFIASTKLSANATTITVNDANIANYSSLVIFIHYEVNAATGLRITLNNDGGANYTQERVEANGAVFSAAGNTLAYWTVDTGVDNKLITLNIANIAGKTKEGMLFSPRAANTIIQFASVFWNNNSNAISRIDITTTTADNILSGSYIAVYGVEI